MSFLGNLAKGFIQSAVNQVGRDSGKVVSNNVFGNSHSTPINTFSNVLEENIVSNERIVENSDLIKKKEYPLLKIFYALILSVFFPIIGSFIVLYRAFVNLNAKKMTMYRIQNQGVYSSDKRYSSGQMYVGNTTEKIPVQIDITEQEKKIKKYKGISYLLISIAFIAIYFYSFSNGGFDKEKSIIESKPINNFSSFEIILPESDYKYLAEISEIQTEIIKNAITVKEDKYSVEKKIDGYRISLTLSIKNPYKKEMIVPFYDDIFITSENNKSFSNSKDFKKRFGEIIKPRIVYKENNKSIINYEDCKGGIACIHYKPLETKQFKLFFDNEVEIDVKNVVFLGFDLTHDDESNSGYSEKGLIINIDQKKIIGEKKY
jgi:hypothetical protein